MTNPQLVAAALGGLALGLGLIVAIGAQNAFVLRQGIRREHVVTVVLICIASDALLILAGVAGAGVLFTRLPWLVTAARWGGALFLLSYAALAARRALRRPIPGAGGLLVDTADASDVPGPGEEPRPHRAGVSGDDAERGGAVALRSPAAGILTEPRTSRVAAVGATTLAMTWLNPHVYLDTFVLLGSVGSSHGPARWAFASGAILSSALWFSALGLAARSLAPVFARPVAWRVLDGVIAVVMTAVAAGLLVRT